MLLPRLIGAVGLLSTAAHAAPKGSQFKDAFAARDLDTLPEPPRPHVLRAMFNNTNSTTSPAQQSTQTVVLPVGQHTTLECPTVSIFVSTKMIDVTVYISGDTTVTSTVPCEDDVTKTVDDIVTEHCTHPHCTRKPTTTTANGGLETVQTITNGHWNTTMTSIRSHTSTEPCSDDPIVQTPGNLTMQTIHQTASPTEEPCDDITVTNTLTISGSVTKVTSTVHRTLTSTEPCPDDLTMTPGGNFTMQTQTMQHGSTMTEEPCEVVTDTLTIDGSVTKITSTIHRTSMSTEPCSDDTSMSSMASTNTASFSNSTTSAISTSSTGSAISTNSTGSATAPSSTGSVTSAGSGTSASSTNTADAGPVSEATIGQSSASTTTGSTTGASSTLSSSSVTSTSETATTSGTSTSLSASSETTTTATPSTTTSSTTTTSSSTTETSSSTSLTTSSETTTTSSTTPSSSSTSETSSTTSSATTSSETTSSTSSTATTSSALTTTTASPTTTSSSTTTSQSIAPTQVLGENAPAGAPEPNTVYCDIKGQPIGTDLISELVENGPGIDVTLEGCFELCQSNTRCEAYRFLYDVPNRPRCALYSASISNAVRAIDRNDGNQWFDVLCGSPSEWIINYG